MKRVPLLDIEAEVDRTHAKLLRIERNRIKARRAKLKAEAIKLSGRQEKLEVMLRVGQFTGDAEQAKIRIDALNQALTELAVKRGETLSRSDHVARQSRAISRISRALHLARMFVAGTPLQVCEVSNRPDRAQPDWVTVALLVETYAPHMHNQLGAWRDAAGRGMTRVDHG